MVENRRYYWLKLKETFWNDAPILFMRSLPSGDTLVIIYLKLLGMSAQNNGYIAFEGNYGTIEDEIALILRENKVNVQMALAAMKQAELIIISEDLIVQFTRIGEMVGIASETASAIRVREFRAKKALENKHAESNPLQKNSVTMKHQCNTLETKCNTEIEKEIDKEKKIENRGIGIFKNVYLSENELDNLIKLYPDDYSDKINNLSEYMFSSGKSYKDHYLTICRWAREDNKKQKFNLQRGRIPANIDYSFKEGESL